MQRTALILGVSGQDGSYLAELLLNKGYLVSGMIRRSSSYNTERLDPFFDKLDLHYGDLTDSMSIRSILTKVEPDEVYNLAAQSHVKVSFDVPCYSFSVGADGALNVLEAVRDFRDSGHDDVKFYQASSSEMFGSSPPPQDENTAFNPRSPYAAAKVAAYHLTRTYREAYGLFACNGLLFNHESPRRTPNFVTRKITRAATRIKAGLQEELRLGNLDARRDWGFAGDYVDAMWRMLQKDEPGDYVVGTGTTHTVREWLEWSFDAIGLDWQAYVHIDPRYMRPTEVDALQADPRKAQQELDWVPTVGPKALCHMMIESDMQLAEREKRCSD